MMASKVSETLLLLLLAPVRSSLVYLKYAEHNQLNDAFPLTVSLQA